MSKSTEQKQEVNMVQTPSMASQATNPEPGNKLKTKATLTWMDKGALRDFTGIALVDSGQTLNYDGIISQNLWQNLQCPPTEPRDPRQGRVGTARVGAYLAELGVVKEGVRMKIRMGNREVPFRPLVVVELSHSLNLGAVFLEKYGFNVETRESRLYSPELE